MAHRVKVRGIYTTALTKLLLNSGYTIVDPSPGIRQRFSLPPTDEAPDVFIQDRENHQGIEISGESDQLSLLIRLLQETLLDSILLEFAGKAEAPEETEEEAEVRDIARARFEFPGISKAYLDAIRSTIVPSLKNHHRLKILHEKKLSRFEEELLKNPGIKESLENDLFAEWILAPLQKAGLVRLEHIKASGKAIRPREGILVESQEEKLILKRSFSQGRYDGLNIPIEEGDYGLTEVREGAGYVKHAYFSKQGKLKGEYFSINTPVELYPFGARYIDLEIDVICRPGEKPVISDREELAVLVKKGVISTPLERKAVETAEDLIRKMG
jgi:probable ribonuclease FAU-1